MDSAHVDRDAAMWEKVVRQLRSGTMPPAGQPRPDRPTAHAFVAAVETALDRAAALAPDPGRPVVRRLNRVEYTNAIRQLLDLEIDAESLLPPDESLEGFDNVGGVLSISPALFERYMSAARRISRLAVGDRTIGPAFASRTYEVSQAVWQDTRMSEELPFGSRGGGAVRHRFPLDGEYVCRIRLRRNVFGYVRGLGEAHQLEVRLDGQRVKVFTVGGEKAGAPAPLSFTGVFAGDRAWEAHAISADANLEVRFRAGAGTRVVGVSFVEEVIEEEGVRQPPLTGLGFSYDESRSAPTGPWGPAVDSIAIDGPYNVTGPGETASRERLLRCGPRPPDNEESCARNILSTLVRRAYRRPATEQDFKVLLDFFHAGVTRAGFEAGIQSALERLLVDPNFLFRIERDPDNVAPDATYQLSDLELASRLSFFLWSSIPDDELLDVAVAGKLRNPLDVDRQVRRMLADGRAASLVDNFAVQWLSLRRLREVTPDPEIFSDFDGNLRAAFERETELFVQSQLREDRSLLDLLTANDTFVNERLAHHYQIPNIYGSQFRRVTLSDPVRAGLLGQGSILTLTSYPTRTSPVVRGRWVLDTILGAPPAPPPPNIPVLPSSGKNENALSVRERTERHRTNPACAGCHARMDPLGFALENFDAIGKWRTSEAGKPIDASGALADGSGFEGVDGLRALVLSQPDEYVRRVTEKLLTYALGRAVEYYDMPAIRKIVREAAPEYRWSSIIRGVVRSVPFQRRRSAS
jgi:hypothetical protein